MFTRQQVVFSWFAGVVVVFGGCANMAELTGRRCALRPEDLRCEYFRNPVGIDEVKPRLSWVLESSRRNQVQSAYQVLVAGDREKLEHNEGNLWDSGRVDSNQSAHVVYGGRALSSQMRCCWKVRVWDEYGRVSQWSEPATWSMGLLREADWKADWITSSEMEITDKPIHLDKWLWHPGGSKVNQTVYFRTVLDLREEPTVHHSIIAVSADNKYTLYVNGERLGASSDFTKVQRYTTRGRANLHGGRNVIAVEVENADGPAGLTLGVRVTYFGGDRQEIQPIHWLCSERAAGDWMSQEFDASNWVTAKVVGDYGGEPWGRLKQDFDGPRRSFMVRKDFAVPSEVVDARVYVSGLGMYRLHINGRRVGNDLFTPGWTVYSRRIQYQTYDVTNLLHRGDNAVGAILGNGWWSSGLGWAGGNERHSKKGQNLRFLMQLEIDCADGSHHTVVTDGTWKTHFSPVLANTLYHGVAYDARLEMPGWAGAGFDDRGWKWAVACYEPSLSLLCAQKSPTLQVVKHLEPVKITEPREGVYVFDFGQNHSGRCRLKVKAPAGTKVQIRHAEILRPDGLIDNVNYRSARVTDTYICRGGGVEVFDPLFTYRGFRYAQVTGLPGKPGKQTLVSQVFNSAAKMTGEFECSDPLLNRIAENIQWGQRSNMYSVPTDCPQRDERLGWMGDAQAFAPTSCWNMDMAMFFTKWMRDIRESQKPSGATTDVCPAIVVTSDAKSAWGDAVAVVPWVVYQYYGDKRILEENYESIKAWVEYLRANSEDRLYEKDTYGDWVPVVKTPGEPVSAAYTFYSTKLLSEIAKVLGKEADAVEYAALAQQIAEAFHSKYFHPDSQDYINGTQTANLLPLCFGITPDTYHRAVAENIIDDVIERGRHHSTGFLGTPLILPTLSRFGRADLAYDIITTDEYPSLGYMIRNGATTIWERWNTDKMGPGMNSRNHFAFGSMGEWLYEAVAGINIDPEKPGFKHIIIRPHPGGGLTFARAGYESVYGRITSHWRRKGDALELEVTIPANTTATVYVPAGDAGLVTESGRPTGRAEEVTFLRMEDGAAVYRVGSGRYVFRSRSWWAAG